MQSYADHKDKVANDHYEEYNYIGGTAYRQAVKGIDIVGNKLRIGNNVHEIPEPRLMTAGVYYDKMKKLGQHVYDHAASIAQQHWYSDEHKHNTANSVAGHLLKHIHSHHDTGGMFDAIVGNSGRAEEQSYDLSQHSAAHNPAVSDLRKLTTAQADHILRMHVNARTWSEQAYHSSLNNLKKLHRNAPPAVHEWMNKWAKPVVHDGHSMLFAGHNQYDSDAPSEAAHNWTRNHDTASIFAHRKGPNAKVITAKVPQANIVCHIQKLQKALGCAVHKSPLEWESEVITAPDKDGKHHVSHAWHEPTSHVKTPTGELKIKGMVESVNIRDINPNKFDHIAQEKWAKKHSRNKKVILQRLRKLIRKHSSEG